MRLARHPSARRQLAGIALMAAGTAAAIAGPRYVDRVVDGRRAEVAARGDVPPGATAKHGRPDRVGAEAVADVDGDGRGDRTWLVRSNHDPLGAWIGVRTESSRHGRRTAWWSETFAPAEPRIDGFADVDGNGSREVVVSTVAPDGGRSYRLATLAGDRLVLLLGMGLTTSTTPAGTSSWGCEGGRVYVASLSTGGSTRHGTVTYYRLRGDRLVTEGREEHSIARGTPVPPIYDPTAPRCAGVVPPPGASLPGPGTPAPRPGEVAVPDSAVRGEVDGDGRADTVTLLESGERGDEAWRYGVRVAATSAGVSVAWAEPGEGGNDAQRLDGVADVNGDGRGEVAVARGTTVGATSYALVTLHGGRARFVRGAAELWVGRHDGSRGWGCRDGLVYATTARRAAGTVAWYRLAGDRLVHVRSDTRRWRAGTTPPAPFGERISCGAFRAP